MKLVVLTGCSRGLGYALYEQLIGIKNIKLVCVSKNMLTEQLRLSESNQDNFNFIKIDLSEADREEFESTIEDRILESIGAENYNEIVFISNAGVIEPIGMVGLLDGHDIDMAVNVNFIAPMLVSQVLVRLAEALSVKLKIVNISSGAANHPIHGWALYCSTKAAIKMFFDVMSRMPSCEITHVDPGVLNTDMQLQIRRANKNDFPEVNAFRDMQKNGRLADPAIIARNIVKNNILK